ITGSNGEIRYLVIGYSDDILTLELSSLKDIGRILGSVKVGENGFVFCVDKTTWRYLYFNDGVNDLTGQSAASNGITSEALNDGFFGLVELKSGNYYCSSKTYNSQEFGDIIVITAAISESELLGKNVAVIATSVTVFLIVLFIIFAYGAFMQIEYIKTKKTPKSFRMFVGKKKLHKAAAGAVYFNVSIAKKLGVLIIVGVILIFGSSMFMQSYLALESSIKESEVSIDEIENLMGQNEGVTNTIVHYYNNHYIAKTQQLASLFEYNPTGLFEYDIRDEHVYKYKNKDLYSKCKDVYLNELCKINDIEEIYIFNDEGYCIATSATEWDFYISENEEDQSGIFRKILEGKMDTYAQGLMTSESGLDYQYFGSMFYYYTDADGNFVSKYDYEKDDINIRRHRGLVQTSISKDIVSDLMEITSASYVIGQVIPTENAQFFVFDMTPEHRIIYSENDILIGMSAMDLGFDEGSFKTASYNGFTSLDSQKFFEVQRFQGQYYTTILTPTESVYNIRSRISLVTTIAGAIALILMSGFIIIHTQEEENAYCAVKYDEQYKIEYDTVTITLPSGKVKQIKMENDRVANMPLPWSKKDPEQRLGTVTRILLGLFTIAVCITLIVESNSQDSLSIMPYIAFGSWSHGFNFFALCHNIMVLLGLSLVLSLIDAIVSLVATTLGSAMETFGQFIVSLIKYGSIIAALFYCLFNFGIDGTSLIASAGILSLVIGLGAQSLISDILSGIFIAMEGSFRVGDIVEVNGFYGQVIEMGLRTTKIKDIGNNIKIINNHEISSILNKTRDTSLAVCRVGIEYSEDINRVDDILRKEFPAIKKRIPIIIDEPFLIGIDKLGDSSVELLIAAKCTEQNRLRLERMLNREIFELFKRENINIPFPQVTISNREDTLPKEEIDKIEVIPEESKKKKD
ncbi:MAG: mechanosensitive ion channel family protein, partial [Clostridia bacterium]|nr:mechanosensitive ion channel family protein [Clostridia bacterium]